MSKQTAGNNKFLATMKAWYTRNSSVGKMTVQAKNNYSHLVELVNSTSEANAIQSALRQAYGKRAELEAKLIEAGVIEAPATPTTIDKSTDNDIHTDEPAPDASHTARANADSAKPTLTDKQSESLEDIVSVAKSYVEMKGTIRRSWVGKISRKRLIELDDLGMIDFYVDRAQQTLELTDAGRAYAIENGWLTTPATANVDAANGAREVALTGDERAVLDALNFSNASFMTIKHRIGLSHDELLKALKSLREKGAISQYSDNGEWYIPNTTLTMDMILGRAAHATPANDSGDAETTGFSDWRHQWNMRHIKAAYDAEFKTVAQEIIVSLHTELMTLQSENAAHEYIDAETAHYAPYFEKQIADEIERLETYRVMREIAIAEALGLHKDTFLNEDTEVIVDAIKAANSARDAAVAALERIAGIIGYSYKSPQEIAKEALAKLAAIAQSGAGE